MPKIDHINQGGETYMFVDQQARDDCNVLSERVGRMNDQQTKALQEEQQRATDAERALENAKVSKVEGKTLSTNDFSDEYKCMLDHPKAMTGATAMTDGLQGDVPAPTQGQEGLFLRGDAKWEKPHDTTYKKATKELDGLMAKEDKDKLDNIDPAQDDVVSCQTEFLPDGSIVETLGNGKTKKTVFRKDGSIQQKITNSAGSVLTLTTTFNPDGSITRTAT